MRLDHLPVLGAGMEGTVLDLGDGRVAKVWHGRTPEQVEAARAFGEALASSSFPYAVPRVLDVLEQDGRLVTIEPFLAGRPATKDDVDALAAVLRALAAVAPDSALAALPVLPGEQPFSADEPFTHQLADLVRRRTDRYRDTLLARLPALDDAVALTAERLHATRVPAPSLVHGDLIPANVLVDDDGAPSAVLDFGFLTTVGDPAFDAAVTASIADMYSPEHRAVEARVDAAVGGDPEVRATYRAAYALVTSNCFSEDGSDGHFAWCADLVERVVSTASTRR